jgi:hypothetical protein
MANAILTEERQSLHLPDHARRPTGRTDDVLADEPADRRRGVGIAQPDTQHRSSASALRGRQARADRRRASGELSASPPRIPDRSVDGLAVGVRAPGVRNREGIGDHGRTVGQAE